MIEADAFYNSGKLTQLTFAENSALERIESRAFAGTSITSFVAPPGLRELGALVFQDCARLERVVLNDSLQIVGASCFQGASYAKLLLAVGTSETDSGAV